MINKIGFRSFILLCFLCVLCHISPIITALLYVKNAFFFCCLFFFSFSSFFWSHHLLGRWPPSIAVTLLPASVSHPSAFPTGHPPLPAFAPPSTLPFWGTASFLAHQGLPILTRSSALEKPLFHFANTFLNSIQCSGIDSPRSFLLACSLVSGHLPPPSSPSLPWSLASLPASCCWPLNSMGHPIVLHPGPSLLGSLGISEALLSRCHPCLWACSLPSCLLLYMIET